MDLSGRRHHVRMRDRCRRCRDPRYFPGIDRCPAGGSLGESLYIGYNKQRMGEADRNLQDKTDTSRPGRRRSMMRRGMRQPLSTVFREAVTPAKGRFLWRRSAPVTILAAMTFIFQACEEDIAFPQPEKAAAWEEIDTGYESGWIYAMTRGMSGEIIVGASGRNDWESRSEVFISRDGGESWEGSGRDLIRTAGFPPSPAPTKGSSLRVSTREGSSFRGMAGKTGSR